MPSLWIWGEGETGKSFGVEMDGTFRRDKPTVADKGVGRSKLSDIPYFTDDGGCSNRIYSRDTGENPS